MVNNNQAPLMQWWEEKGFGAEPMRVIAAGGEKICRAYSPSKVTVTPFTPGQFLKPDVPFEPVVEGSRLWGNCFFVPKNAVGADGRIGAYDVPQQAWSGIELEKQLNAWFWGNLYHKVAVFEIRRDLDFDTDIAYFIGPVGQDTRARIPVKRRVVINGKVVLDRNGKPELKEEMTIVRHLNWGNADDLLQVAFPIADFFDGDARGLPRPSAQMQLSGLIRHLASFDVKAPLDTVAGNA